MWFVPLLVMALVALAVTRAGRSREEQRNEPPPADRPKPPPRSQEQEQQQQQQQPAPQSRLPTNEEELQEALLEATTLLDPVARGRRRVQLAQLLEANSRPVEALRVYDQALADFEGHIPNESSLVPLLAGVAGVRFGVGQLRAAEEAQRRALALALQYHGDVSAQTMTQRRALGALLVAREQHREAEPLLLRVLAWTDALAPVDAAVQFERVRVRRLLASCYEGQARFTDAEPLRRQVLDEERRRLGERAVELGGPLTELAHLCRRLGKLDDAELLYQEALALVEASGEIASGALATAAHNLGMLRCQQGDFTRAEPLLLRALAADERALGPGSPQLVGRLRAIAQQYRLFDQLGECLFLLERAYGILTAMWGTEHRELSGVLAELASARMARSDYEGADEALDRALRIARQCHAPAGETADLLDAAAAVSRYLGRGALAQSQAREAFGLREQILGPNHPELALRLRGLAEGMASMGDHDQAEQLLERALAVQEATFGPEHGSLVNTLHALSSIEASRGRLDEAEVLLDRALGIAEREHGADSPALVHLVESQAALLSRRGRPIDAERLRARVERMRGDRVRRGTLAN